MLSMEFLIKLKKTLPICSLSQLNKIFSSFLVNEISIDLSISYNNFKFSFKILTKLLFFKIGLGILAKSENSLTKFSICLI